MGELGAGGGGRRATSEAADMVGAWSEEVRAARGLDLTVVYARLLAHHVLLLDRPRGEGKEGEEQGGERGETGCVVLQSSLRGAKRAWSGVSDGHGQW